MELSFLTYFYLFFICGSFPFLSHPPPPVRYTPPPPPLECCANKYYIKSLCKNNGTCYWGCKYVRRRRRGEGGGEGRGCKQKLSLVFHVCRVEITDVVIACATFSEEIKTNYSISLYTVMICWSFSNILNPGKTV